jgi:hypothetical protein
MTVSAEIDSAPDVPRSGIENFGQMQWIASIRSGSECLAISPAYDVLIIHSHASQAPLRGTLLAEESMLSANIVETIF